jgi:hypothetical protein
MTKQEALTQIKNARSIQEKSNLACAYACSKAGAVHQEWNNIFEDSLTEIGFYLEKLKSSDTLKSDAPYMAPIPFEHCEYHFRYPSFVAEIGVDTSEWIDLHHKYYPLEGEVT